MGAFFLRLLMIGLCVFQVIALIREPNSSWLWLVITVASTVSVFYSTRRW